MILAVLLLLNVAAMVWNLFNVLANPGDSLYIFSLMVSTFAVGWLGSYLVWMRR